MLPVECVVRGYLAGGGWKRVQARRPRVRHPSCRTACRSPSGCPSRSSRPPRRPRRATTSRSTSSRRRELVGSRELAERLRDVSLAVYGAVAEHARARGVILADTKFEFGLDADGQLTLGDEVCTPDSSRFWPADEYEPGRSPALVRQAVRARLGRGHRVGQVAARAGDPRRRRRPDARALRARVRAAGGRAVLGVGGARRGTATRPSRGRAQSLIRPKAGILDPQGQAVERALPALGFGGRRGRARRPADRARRRGPDRLAEMCEQLLANPLIEDYEIDLEPSS